MAKKAKINIAEVAKIMHKEPQYIRYGLRQGRLPFGSAVQNESGRWSYHIVLTAFCEYMKMTEEEVLAQCA